MVRQTAGWPLDAVAAGVSELAARPVTLMTLDAPGVVAQPGLAEVARLSVVVRGVVQGVGFRPFVFGLATRLGLVGFVRNDVHGVRIEVEGEPPLLASFLARLQSECPTVARIEDVEAEAISVRGERGFAIAASDTAGPSEERFIAPDLATCDACLGELFDPRDRRHRYPFVNCAHCGPRLSIVGAAPYDRERTSMANFPMCAACRAEYEDPSSRRFHAEAIACPACGPRLAAHDEHGQPVSADPLAFCMDLLHASRIVALKGIGGYHLACDATSDVALRRLRARKHRDEKPFAIMVADVASARRLCRVSTAEAALLSSPRRPIVLLRRHLNAQIAPAVAPDNPLLGVLLPYTPLHHLLLREAGRPLVLTSGNRSDEPIAFEDARALESLTGIADGFLTHDRRIQGRCDDSVARVGADGPTILRRSRGYAPEPLRLGRPCAGRILAVGGHLKNTFALGRDGYAFLSHHLGDLDDWDAYGAFREAVAHYEALFAFRTEVLAHDLHPGYATTHYAQERQARAGTRLRLVGVQHHHAHVASCMVENGLAGPVIGVAFDGTGYGSDGSLWGGEFLVGDCRSVHRAAHLRAVALAGGERAIREPWRMAVAHLLDCDLDPASFVAGNRRKALPIVCRMLEAAINSPMTSSVGRLFDAVAALVAQRDEVSFEGQAAMELEWLAAACDSQVDDAYPFEVATDDAGGPLVVDTRPLVRGVVEALRSGASRAAIARQFHCTVVEIITRVVLRLREQTGIGDVVLTGGVFQNRLVREATKRKLGARGLQVYAHARVPTNDGGLSLGQLAVAAAAEGERHVPRDSGKGAGGHARPRALDG